MYKVSVIDEYLISSQLTSKAFGVEWYGLKKITKWNQVTIAKWLSPVYC